MKINMKTLQRDIERLEAKLRREHNPVEMSEIAMQIVTLEEMKKGL